MACQEKTWQERAACILMWTHTPEAATLGTSLPTPWQPPCYNTMNVRSGCSLMQKPPAWEDGSLFSPGQTPAGHAELPVNLGHLIRSQIYLQKSGLHARYGIILSNTMQISGEALHRRFYAKMSST